MPMAGDREPGTMFAQYDKPAKAKAESGWSPLAYKIYAAQFSARSSRYLRPKINDCTASCSIATWSRSDDRIDREADPGGVKSPLRNTMVYQCWRKNGIDTPRSNLHGEGCGRRCALPNHGIISRSYIQCLRSESLELKKK